MHLRALTANDEIPLSVLMDTTFGGPEMYQFARELRAENAVAMERIAYEGDTLLGYICCARMVVPEDWWALSILAVSPMYHKRGMGRELVAHGMDHARREGARAVVVVADPKYFSRVGFSQLAASKLELPMMAEHTSLYPIAPGTGMSTHRLIYPEAYERLMDGEPRKELAQGARPEAPKRRFARRFLSI
ncbi:GNAT family N-acetyltransferase [Celeribacter neptunius]|uniref:Putative acetyltransferase n=1 Tax=Celeribacter neptunius TaxID=588602 RepID=A0A1I3W482_9RHOB|nr:GNAT family N-acetyltransferase [Celeribacter neptunius]SFK02099.1 putative acetyltransferase [Celeribacter neptunius]